MPEEVAEGERGENFWRELIERQRQQRENPDNSWRERLRSLPDEQQQEKEKGRGMLMDEQQVAWLETLQYASRNAGHQREMER